MARAKVAAAQWRGSSFRQRRLLMKILLKYVVENQEQICRWGPGGCGGLLGVGGWVGGVGWSGWVGGMGWVGGGVGWGQPGHG